MIEKQENLNFQERSIYQISSFLNCDYVLK